MKTNKKLRLQYLFQNSFFILLFFALILLIGILSNQFVFVKDMTQASRSILTKGSIEILESMNGPINMTVFATNDDANKGDNFKKGLLDFVAKYQREKKDITISFINPTLEPKLVEELGIRTDGEVIARVAGHAGRCQSRLCHRGGIRPCRSGARPLGGLGKARVGLP